MPLAAGARRDTVGAVQDGGTAVVPENGSKRCDGMPVTGRTSTVVEPMAMEQS